MAASPGSGSISSTGCAPPSDPIAGVDRPPEAAPETRRILYGRRRGHKLRPAQSRLLEDALPRLAIPLPAAGETLAPQGLFAPQPRAVWLEIGFGGGEHLAALAAAHPEIGFIGCEVFENGIVKLLAEVQRRSLANVRILADDARLLLAALGDASIDRAFILFPDPWPKQRHHKRRIVSAATLTELARGMAEGAELRLATDDPGYMRWMLALAPVHPGFEWLVGRPSECRRRPPDWPPTRYEAKAIAAGRIPLYLTLQRRRLR
jgi:tRNA (guanine-N7-)-methyltransferase